MQGTKDLQAISYLSKDPSVNNDEMDLIMITENVLPEGYTYRQKNVQ